MFPKFFSSNFFFIQCAHTRKPFNGKATSICNLSSRTPFSPSLTLLFCVYFFHTLSKLPLYYLFGQICSLIQGIQQLPPLTLRHIASLNRQHLRTHHLHPWFIRTTIQNSHPTVKSFILHRRQNKNHRNLQFRPSHNPRKLYITSFHLLSSIPFHLIMSKNNSNKMKDPNGITGTICLAHMLGNHLSTSVILSC
jgi:hypothetical protein